MFTDPPNEIKGNRKNNIEPNPNNPKEIAAKRTQELLEEGGYHMTFVKSPDIIYRVIQFGLRIPDDFPEAQYVLFTDAKDKPVAVGKKQHGFTVFEEALFNRANGKITVVPAKGTQALPNTVLEFWANPQFIKFIFEHPVLKKRINIKHSFYP